MPNTPRTKFYDKSFTPRKACRRRWGRYPIRDANVAVLTDLVEFEAKVVDESIGGLGLQTNDPATLFGGQWVVVCYRDDESLAVVTGVFDSLAGVRRFSVRWEEDAFEIANLPDHPFILVDSLIIACQILSDEEESPARIRLWNRDEFQVDPERLIYRTREARRNELWAMKNRIDRLASIYGLESCAESERLIESIIELEFGEPH